MRRKEFTFIVVILIIVFAGITLFKYIGQPDHSGSATEVVKSDSIKKFWIYYNRATEYRL